MNDSGYGPAPFDVAQPPTPKERAAEEKFQRQTVLKSLRNQGFKIPRKLEKFAVDIFYAGKYD